MFRKRLLERSGHRGVASLDRNYVYFRIWSTLGKKKLSQRYTQTIISNTYYIFCSFLYTHSHFSLGTYRTAGTLYFVIIAPLNRVVIVVFNFHRVFFRALQCVVFPMIYLWNRRRFWWSSVRGYRTTKGENRKKYRHESRNNLRSDTHRLIVAYFLAKRRCRRRARNSDEIG